jgi:hypothetical protein
MTGAQASVRTGTRRARPSTRSLTAQAATLCGLLSSR